MKSFSQKLMLAFTVLGLANLSLATGALAASPDAERKLEVKGQLTLQYITEEDRDLNISGDDRVHSFSEQAQMSVKAKLSDDLTAFVLGRALNIDGDAGFDDDTGQTVSTEDSFLELRELWLRWDNIGGILPLSAQAGRQRVREPRSLWWNQDFDMVRAIYDTTLLKGFIGAGENLTSYRTGDGDDFMEQDENRFRFLGEGVWQYRLDQFLEGRFLAENDHSGLEPVGAIIDANDRDNEDLDAFWAGIRAGGLLAPDTNSLHGIRYRADLIGLTGDVDTLTTIPGLAPGTREVTGATDSNVRAWAFDGQVDVDTKLPLNPVFTAGYAFGSGDDDATDGTDNAFRQTGMQGTSSRMGVARQAQKYYGEVLRPELSNLHIVTLGAGAPLTDATDASLTYFNYHLDEDAGDLRSSGIRAPLSGTDNDVGQALDFIVNVDIDQQFNVRVPVVDDLDFRFVVGTFFPGDAYSPNDDVTAYRVFTEIKARL
jgi:alginate production protein